MKKKISFLMLVTAFAVMLLLLCSCNQEQEQGMEQVQLQPGINYALYENFYKIAYYIQEEGVSKLVIPEQYNGKPVKEIGYLPLNSESESVAFTPSNAYVTPPAFVSGNPPAHTVFIYGAPPNDLHLIGSINESNITSLTIPKSITKIGDNALILCATLNEIVVDAENSEYKSVDGNLYSKDGNTLVRYCGGKSENKFVIPDTVTNIADGAFAFAENLTEIIMPDSITEIGSYAFKGCSGLKNITIPNSVVSIGEAAFAGCVGIDNMVIPRSVIDLGKYAFGHCTKIKVRAEAEVKPDGWDKEWCRLGTLEYMNVEKFTPAEIDLYYNVIVEWGYSEN